MQKIVINNSFGSCFRLSKKAYEFLGLEWDDLGTAYYDDRANEKLVECVEKLGVDASGENAYLYVCEIPDDVGDNWYIDEYNDGMEQIREMHRIWY